MKILIKQTTASVPQLKIIQFLSESVPLLNHLRVCCPLPFRGPVFIFVCHEETNFASLVALLNAACAIGVCGAFRNGDGAMSRDLFDAEGKGWYYQKWVGVTRTAHDTVGCPLDVQFNPILLTQPGQIRSLQCGLKPVGPHCVTYVTPRIPHRNYLSLKFRSGFQNIKTEIEF